MAFSFSSAGYNFPAKWSAAERQHAQQIMSMGVKYGSRASDMIRMFQRAGISYRKTNMLSDIARAQAVEQSKTASAYKAADKWFDTLEKVRAQTEGKTRAEALDIMQQWKTESWKSIDTAQLATALEAEGECPSPPC